MSDIKRKMLLRGSSLLAVSVVCLLLYWLSIVWYLSLLPAAVLLIFSLGDLFGIKKAEKYRKSYKVLLSDEGITIIVHGVNKPITWSWSNISILKVRSRSGVLKSFTINTGDKYLKKIEFSDDLSSFSDLYKEVYNRVRV